MTLSDLQAAASAGKVTSEEPAQTPGSGSGAPALAPSSGAGSSVSANENTDITQFIPLLVQLQSIQAWLPSAPTVAPQTFEDQIQFVYDGTNYYLYFWANNQWNKLQAGNSGWNQKSGTDPGPTFTSHGTSQTNTVTHGLGKRPSIILVSTTINPNGVPGANTNKGLGVGSIMLDGFGNAIGGIAMWFFTGSPAGAFGLGAYSSLPTSIGASTVTTGGTANMSITVQNVTATSFDIVYSVSDNGAFGAPTQTFPDTIWNVFG